MFLRGVNTSRIDHTIPPRPSAPRVVTRDFSTIVLSCVQSFPPDATNMFVPPLLPFSHTVDGILMYLYDAVCNRHDLARQQHTAARQSAAKFLAYLADIGMTYTRPGRLTSTTLVKRLQQLRMPTRSLKVGGVKCCVPRAVIAVL